MEKKGKIDFVSFKKRKIPNKMRAIDIDLNDTTYCRGLGLIISAITNFLLGPCDYIF